MKKKQLFLPLLCLALLLSGCGGNGGEAAFSPPPAETEDVSPTPEPTPEPPEPGRVMDPEDVKRLEGSWECIGIRRHDELMMFIEYPQLSQLYDQILLINGDGTYSYLDAFSHRGVWDPVKVPDEGSEYFYRFSREYDITFNLDEDDDSFVTETESSGSYLASVSDDLPGIMLWLEEIGGESVTFVYQRDEDEDSGWSGAAPSVPAAPAAPSVPAASSAAPTTGERNALDKARDYLDFMAFSYSGLVEQLEYEGFLHSEAVYGADNCGADWYEQAALKAADYLEFMPFSRSGLIEQLEYEGFTHDQAVYGAEQNGY